MQLILVISKGLKKVENAYGIVKMDKAQL
jgi:hypothetical protein